MSASWRLICLCVAVALVASAGCEKHTKELAGSTPPAGPAGQPTTGRMYDYSQKVKETAKLRAGKKWTIAILRFGDTKDVEGVPFGAASQPSQTGNGQVNVNVKVGPDAPAGPVETAPQMFKRAREILKHELVQSQAFTVVERERILDILREMNFGKSKLVNPEAGSDEASLLPVKYLIEGSVGYNQDKTLKDNLDKGRTYKDAGDYPPGVYDNVFKPTGLSRGEIQSAIEKMRKEYVDYQDRSEFNISCYLSVYNVHTGEVVTTVMGLGSNPMEAIQDAVDDLIAGLAAMDNDMCVASVGEDKLYLDAGVNAGIKVGGRYQLMHQGKAIRDKEGQIIGREEKEVGEIEVTDVKPMMSIAKVVTGKIGDVARGDVAKPVKK